jgi:hypothetical protein
MWGRRETMKLEFAPSIGPFDFECIVHARVKWDCDEPTLVVDNVTNNSGGRLMFSEDKLLVDIAHRIADLAEDDTKLLARAVAQDNDEREAA